MSVEQKLMESKLDPCWKAVARAARDLNENFRSRTFSKEYSSTTNATGDQVLKVDVLANHLFLNGFRDSYCCAALASEELKSIEIFHNTSFKDYLVCIDPLDGSDNYKTDNQVGTIFSVLRNKGRTNTEADFFQAGKDIAAAGYVLYGPQPIMVVADSITNTVRSFIINDNVPGSTKPLLTEYQNDIKCPEEGKIVAVNSGNYPRWNQLTCNWFDTVVEYGKSSFRYSGCMVADFHRILLQGGIFAYPSDRKNLNGKLRLLFECAPLAFIMEMAGGASTNGDSKTKSILDITPTSLHQTTPVFLGSKQNIEDYFRG